MRSIGCRLEGPYTGRLYPSPYRSAVDHIDLLIQLPIPLVGYIPGDKAVEHMIAAAESENNVEVLDILREHLEAFQNGQSITEQAP